jgi:S-disulfanyl-L-cysteine oxidoreductase SoxD
MKRFFPFVLLLLFAALAANVHSQSATRSVRDGVYTVAQADRGATMYEARCASCHSRDAFAGRYLYSWTGQGADTLFDTIWTSMPEDDPGGLTRPQNADVLAFIFSRNGFPAGPNEMESTPEALKGIVIELPVPGK